MQRDSRSASAAPTNKIRTSGAHAAIAGRGPLVQLVAETSAGVNLDDVGILELALVIVGHAIHAANR